MRGCLPLIHVPVFECFLVYLIIRHWSNVRHIFEVYWHGNRDCSPEELLFLVSHSVVSVLPISRGVWNGVVSSLFLPVPPPPPLSFTSACLPSRHVCPCPCASMSYIALSCLSCPMSILPCPDCPGSVPGRMHLLLHIHLNWLSKGTRVLVMSNKSLGDSVSQCSCRPCPSQVSLLLGTHQAHGGGHDGMRGGQVAGLQLLVTLRYRSRVG